MASKVSKNRPSTSSAPSPPPDSSNSSEKTFTYDIAINLKIETPVSNYDSDKALAAASATLVSHIFTSHPEWTFLATPVLRVVDSALLIPDNKWETVNDRLVFQKDFRIRGNFVNIKEKPDDSDPIFDKLAYNGCLDSSKVVLEYKIDFQFLPGIIAALRVYDAHEWKRNEISQDDDARSIKLKEIIDHYEGKTSVDYEYTWREAFKVGGKIEKQKATGTKRKHVDN